MQTDAFPAFETTLKHFNAFWLCVHTKTIENAYRIHQKCVHSKALSRVETVENGAYRISVDSENGGFRKWTPLY